MNTFLSASILSLEYDCNRQGSSLIGKSKSTSEGRLLGGEDGVLVLKDKSESIF
jgi:hypothetical protein